MNNKLFATFLFGLFYGFGIAQTPPNFKIFGKVDNLNGTYIYLSYEGTKSGRKWDSTLIRNNSFAFSGRISESKNGFLTILKKNRVSTLSDPKITERIFIDPNSTTEIDIINSANFHTAKIQGSPSHIQYELFQKLKEQNSQNPEDFLKKYISENYNSYVGLYLLNKKLDSFSFKQLEGFYKNLSADLKNSEYGKYLSDLLSELETSIPGKKAINFTAKDIHGKTLTLSDFEGKYVLIDFWASWCKPCREKSPELLNLHNKYKDNDFVIIGIAQDESTEKLWKKAIEKDKTGVFLQINGSSNSISSSYSIKFIPIHILLDKNGTIIHRYDGLSEPYENLATNLKEIFKY